MNPIIQKYIKHQQSLLFEKRLKFTPQEIQSAWVAVGIRLNKNYTLDEIAMRIMQGCFVDLSKGTIFWGTKGLGKTLNMDIFATINTELFKIPTSCYEAEEIEYNYKAYGAEYILKLSDLPCLVINDIGRESSILKDYGTDRNIIADLLALRYRKFQTGGFRTFGTTNGKIDDIKKLYVPRIEDRLKEMFNFCEVKGESKR